LRVTGSESAACGSFCDLGNRYFIFKITVLVHIERVPFNPGRVLVRIIAPVHYDFVIAVQRAKETESAAHEVLGNNR